MKFNRFIIFIFAQFGFLVITAFRDDSLPTRFDRRYFFVSRMNSLKFVRAASLINLHHPISRKTAKQDICFFCLDLCSFARASAEMSTYFLCKYRLPESQLQLGKNYSIPVSLRMKYVVFHDSLNEFFLLKERILEYSVKIEQNKCIKSQSDIEFSCIYGYHQISYHSFFKMNNN